MHHVGSLAGLAEALPKEVGDIRLVIYDQNARGSRDCPKSKLTLMMLPLPLPSGEYGATEQ
jgi:hypothetical protein